MPDTNFTITIDQDVMTAIRTAAAYLPDLVAPDDPSDQQAVSAILSAGLQAAALHGSPLVGPDSPTEAGRAIALAAVGVAIEMLGPERTREYETRVTERTRIVLAMTGGAGHAGSGATSH